MATSLSGAVLSFGRLPRLIPPNPGLAVSPDVRALERIRHHVLDEVLFKDTLVRERKRADRFGYPFVLLLLEVRRTSLDSHGWRTILRGLAAAKRDIDMVGWLERGRLIGVIVPGAGAKTALKMEHRVRRELGRRLGDSTVGSLAIHLYCHGDQVGTEGGTVSSADDLLDGLLDRRRPWCDAVKRGLDILGSVMLLILFAPLFASIFTAVKWTSPGPALFRQIRIGRRGEPFAMLKFRTMYENAGHAIHQDYATWFIKSSSKQPRNGHEVFKLTSDPRVTPLGRFLRRTSLDELPQFWNVLRGEMSLVGPRPPLPFEVEQYQAWHRRRVLDAKPGVTGLWQVTGRSRTTFDEMVRLDLRYARTHSLWTDIKILAATPGAMLTGNGAH